MNLPCLPCFTNRRTNDDLLEVDQQADDINNESKDSNELRDEFSVEILPSINVWRVELEIGNDVNRLASSGLIVADERTNNSPGSAVISQDTDSMMRYPSQSGSQNDPGETYEPNERQRGGSPYQATTSLLHGPSNTRLGLEETDPEPVTKRKRCIPNDLLFNASGLVEKASQN